MGLVGRVIHGGDGVLRRAARRDRHRLRPGGPRGRVVAALADRDAHRQRGRRGRVGREGEGRSRALGDGRRLCCDGNLRQRLQDGEGHRAGARGPAAEASGRQRPERHGHRLALALGDGVCGRREDHRRRGRRGAGERQGRALRRLRACEVGIGHPLRARVRGRERVVAAAARRAAQDERDRQGLALNQRALQLHRQGLPAIRFGDVARGGRERHPGGVVVTGIYCLLGIHCLFYKKNNFIQYIGGFSHITFVDRKYNFEISSNRK